MADFGDEVDVTSSMYGAWASEKTLIDLLDTIKDLAGTSEEQKKILQRQVTEIKKTGKATSGGAGGKKDVKLSKELTSGLKKAGSEALDTAAGFDKLSGGPLKDFGKSLKKSSTSMKIGLGVMGGMFGLIGKGIAIYKDNLSVVTGLSDKGLILEEGYLGINRSLAMTGMSLEQFSEFTNKYTRLVGQNGMKALNNFTKEAGAAAGGFHTFGLTTADATEYAAEYLDQQRMAGVFQTALDRKESAALVQNIEDMTRYSKVLNVSRGDLEAASRTMMTNADLQAELFSIEDPDVRKKAQEALRMSALQLASMGEEGQKVSEYLTDIAASPNPYGSASYIQLVENGQTELANSLVNMSNANKSGVSQTLEQTQAMLALTDEQIRNNAALRLNNGAMRDEAVLRTNLGKNAAEAQLQLAENRRKFEEENGKLGEEAFLKWLGQADESAKGAAALEDGVNKVKATMDRFIIEGLTAATKALIGEDGMNGGLVKVGTALSDFSGKANVWLDNLKTSDDPMKMITDTIIGGLSATMKWIADVIVAAIMSLSENTVLGKASSGLSAAMSWFGGEDAKAEQALGGRDAEIAALERRHSMSGGSLGPMTPFNRNQVTGSDISRTASIVNRRTSGGDIGEHSTASMTEFEQRMLTMTEEQQRLIRKQLNEMTGGAYGHNN